MKLISQNSDAQIARNRAREKLAWPFRELTANLLRIVRGAGDPHRLPKQIDDVVDAYKEYGEAFGHYPHGDEIQQALGIRGDWQQRELEDANDAIVSGALRLAAAKLLDQKLQASHGEREMSRGIRFREQVLEERRRKWEAETKAAKGRRSKRKIIF